MNKSMERYLAFGFGVVFAAVLLILAIKFPGPTPFQYAVFRIILALAAGGVAGMIPGFLQVRVSHWIRAGGALAVFVIVYFYSPASLTGVKVTTEQELEVEKPIVTLNDSHEKRPAGFLTHFENGVYARSSASLPILTVTRADQLLRPDVWGKRYQSITIDGVSASVEDSSTIVANEITAIRGGSLTGHDFSVVARRMDNLTIDVSSFRKSGASAGTVRLYVKHVENLHVLANGAPGADGKGGKPGANGADGANGANANCGAFAYKGARPGSDGGNGGNGSNGQPGGNGQNGGLIVLMTIVNPVSSTFDVSGGKPGKGGLGGPAGAAGRGGKGGLGCVGLGGNAQTEKNGYPGRPGHPGAAGHPGMPGSPGEYRLQIVHSFDAIVDKLRTHSNAQLNNALQNL